MGDFEVLFFQPSPWGEGGWPLGQTDEGTGFGLPFVERTVQLGFALRGEFLFHVEKEPKDAGGRRGGELRSPCRLSLPPLALRAISP